MRFALVVSIVSIVSLAGRAQAQDRDADRVPDAADLCPDARETGTLFVGDGCPDTDGDHDGIVDDYDACPTVAETVNGYRDLDGCPDAPGAPGTPPDVTHVGCWDGALLLDVRTTPSGATQLVPRADAPTWMGTAALDCYGGVSFDGRRALHCATADGAREATLALRIDGASAIGDIAFRSEHGLDHRTWHGALVPELDRQPVLDAIEAQGDALQACYESELPRTPGLSGRVTVRVTVATTGETSVAVASDTMTPARPAVAECVVRVIDALVISAPPRCAARTFTFPFAFESGPE